MNKYRNIVFVLIFMGMVSLLVGVTYSFFNYTKTGATNTISVGRINFITRQTESINLSNAFPINRDDIDTDTDNVDEVVIEIEGDTDYSGGIEYLVSSVDSSIYTSSGKLVPIGIDVTVEDLGTSNDSYFTARESTNASIYKKLVGDTLVGDQMLLVGYIVPNPTLGTASGIDGSITIKAFFDEDYIAITDTPEESEEWINGRTALTTTEWSGLQLSFKIRVEANQGIWVTGSLEEIMKKTAVMDNIASTYVTTSSGIDFGESSSDTNGKGVYTRAGTENDPYPIMYYRGEVTDNNVVFGHTCWQAVRTTETGGVKLIYNGPSDRIIYYKNNTVMSNSDITYTNDATYPFTYDSDTKKWTSSNASVNSSSSIITFTVNTSGIYTINYTVSSEERYDRAKFWKNETLLKYISGEYNSSVNLGYLSTTDQIKVEYVKDRIDSSGLDNLSFEIVNNSEEDFTIENCDERESDRLDEIISYVGTGEGNSPAYVGYMHGTIYNIFSSGWTTGARFGSGFTWDGTYYTLIDDSVTTPNDTHHYSCNLSTANGTCSSIRYVTSVYNSNKYYITLTNGKNIDDALNEMFENTTDSAIKSLVDTWYANNLIAYTNRIEDTIWCNDRSIASLGGFSPDGTISSSDWETNDIIFNGIERSIYATSNSTLKNQPSLACTNKNDRFTVKNTFGNFKLTYSIGLITSDEMVLVGYVPTKSSDSYIYSVRGNFWTMTPVFTDFDDSYLFALAYDSYNRVTSLLADTVDDVFGTRPMISIKPGQLITKGTGTLLDPYVID